MHIYRTFFPLVAFLVFSARADTCPPPGGGVKPNVDVKVSFDAKTKFYRYQYTVSNARDSIASLDLFGLYISNAPQKTESPKEWTARFKEMSFSPPPFFQWATYGVDPSIADKPAVGGVPPAHFYALRPGASKTGYVIASSNPPGLVQFFAEGDVSPPTVTATAENDEPDPVCEDWSPDNPRIEMQVTGMTVGPMDPGTKSIRIRAREEKGEKRCSGIDAKKPTGKISVLVFDTREFDVSTIDSSNVYFGPGYAKPVASKLVPNGRGERISYDETVEWERVRDRLRYDRDEKSKSHQNMLLTFNVADLDVQCGLDQALFLRGKSKTGENFIGAVPARVVGCDRKKTGSHKVHHHPFPWWKKSEKK